MTFTGTLIEDLMATVERAEQRAQIDRRSAAEPIFFATSIAETPFAEAFVEAPSVEPWLASIAANTDYDSKFLGVV
jgi:hypothetical protein